MERRAKGRNREHNTQTHRHTSKGPFFFGHRLTLSSVAHRHRHRHRPHQPHKTKHKGQRTGTKSFVCVLSWCLCWLADRFLTSLSDVASFGQGESVRQFFFKGTLSTHSLISHLFSPFSSPHPDFVSHPPSFFLFPVRQFPLSPDPPHSPLFFCSGLRQPTLCSLQL